MGPEKEKCECGYSRDGKIAKGIVWADEEENKKINQSYEDKFEMINKDRRECFNNIAKNIEKENCEMSEKVEKNVNMGEMANAGMCKDDSKTATRLLQKNFSPLIVRKYQMLGWPLFIGIITDANLNDLDKVVYDISDKAKGLGFMNGNIQDARNYCGYLTEELVNYYNNVKRGVTEGIIALWSIDKCVISSAYGDFMTHAKCAQEFYFIVNTLPHI